MKGGDPRGHLACTRSRPGRPTKNSFLKQQAQEGTPPNDYLAGAAHFALTSLTAWFIWMAVDGVVPALPREYWVALGREVA